MFDAGIKEIWNPGSSCVEQAAIYFGLNAIGATLQTHPFECLPIDFPGMFQGYMNFQSGIASQILYLVSWG